jgi:hypothetical protein
MKAIVLLAALTACSGIPKEENSLGESIREFNEGVRWSRFSNAAIHLPAKDRATFVDEWDERAKDLKITDYEVIKVDQKGSRTAQVQVKMEWYKDSEGKVKSTHAVQTWERRGKVWFLVDESRLRGDEMPGLPEPVLKD